MHSLSGDYQYVKDTIGKQITTTVAVVCFTPLVIINMSKIQSESKSQRWCKNME